MSADHPLCLGILLSGGGRTLQNIHDCIQSGRLDARIGCVISSQPDAGGINRVRKMNVPLVIVDRKTVPESDFHLQISEHLEGAGVRLVCMGGFLALWKIPPRYQGRVINIHPALLPEFGGKGFYGSKVHEAVLAAGRDVTGCTVHFCDNEYDHGPIILQRKVPVLPNDTAESLAGRVFEQECHAYPEAIQLFAEKRVRLEEGQVTILDSV